MALANPNDYATDDPELRRQALLNQMPDAPGQGLTDPAVRSAGPTTTLAPDPNAPAPPSLGGPVHTLGAAAGGSGALGAALPPPGAQSPAAAPGDVGAQIDALYKQYGIADGGNGSGFADRAYWSAHPSEVANGRLAADLAGTGTDQPTGTPGTGPWQTSGAADRANGGASQGGGAASASSGAQPFGLQNTGLDMNMIMAELQALITGQKSPSSRSAILSQLKG